MENEKKDKKITIILLIFIIVLFSVLFYCWLDVFEIIDTEDNFSVTNLAEEKIEEVTKPRNKVLMKDDANLIETSVTISKEEQNRILKELSNSSKTEIINTNEKINTSRFYYNQINDTAKILYDKIYENKENLKTGTYKIECGDVFNDILQQDDGTVILKDAYTQAVRSFLFDNPEIFFLEIPKLCIVTETKSTLMSKQYNINIMPEAGGTYLNNQFPTEAIVNSSADQIKKIVENIKIVTEDLDDIEKVKYVHDYLVENIEYDTTIEKPNIHNIYGALINRVAVCEGYAKSFKYIMDKLNIPCIIVVGNANTESNAQEKHSWNYVNIDGKWYGIDATFDDPIVLGAPILGDNIRYKYYLKGSLEFNVSHIINPIEILEFNIEYPKLEEENY